MKGDPHIRPRADGYWEVSGSAGYHTKADAVRVSHQIGRGLRAGRKNRHDAIDPRTTPPGEVFTAYDPDVAASTEELPDLDFVETAATSMEAMEADVDDDDQGDDDDGEEIAETE